MTEHEWKRRMTNPKYKELQITTHEDDKPYVFISYKSDSWELVLAEIVYTLQKKYGLRIYFDKSFNDHNNVWTEQFPKNMEDSNCRAVISFVDNEYYLSYATLLEVMYSQTYQASLGKYNEEGMAVIPVNLEAIKEPAAEVGKKDTGLGIETFADGTKNLNAGTEKELFDKTFDELTKRKFWKKSQYIYDNNKALSKKVCSVIMGEIFSFIHVSENPYKPDMVEFYDSLVNTIKSVTTDVFEAVDNSDPEKLNWNEFDRVKSFSYNGDFYNVADAQNAYISIVDIIHQKDSDIIPDNIVERALPKYVKFEDGTELDIPKSYYGSILKDIVKEKITLYADPVADGKIISNYTILSRNTDEKTEVISNSFSDPFEHFVYYFSEFYDKKNAEWKAKNKAKRMPSIDMEMTVCFNCDCLEHSCIKGNSLNKIFNDILEFFYQMSGNRYFDYIVDVCSKKRTKYPMIINDSLDGDKQFYSQIADSIYLVYNNCSSKELLTYINKHIGMYFDFLKREDALVNIQDVIVDYKIADEKDSVLMYDIRKKGYVKQNSGIDELHSISSVCGTDLKNISKYPSTKGGKGRVKVSYAWNSSEYKQYLSLRGTDKEFGFVEGNAIGIRAFYQFMLWFMINKKVEIGSLVYGIDKNDIDKNGNNRGLRKWKDVLCVSDLSEEMYQLIGAEAYSPKYVTDKDGDLCVYVGGNLLSDNKVFSKMFSELSLTHDISDYVLSFGGSNIG